MGADGTLATIFLFKYHESVYLLAGPPYSRPGSSLWYLRGWLSSKQWHWCWWLSLAPEAAVWASEALRHRPGQQHESCHMHACDTRLPGVCAEICSCQTYLEFPCAAEGESWKRCPWHSPQTPAVPWDPAPVTWLSLELPWVWQPQDSAFGHNQSKSLFFYVLSLKGKIYPDS